MLVKNGVQKVKQIKVNVHDFPDPALEKANPYGVLSFFL
jgi:hypothetical protein